MNIPPRFLLKLTLLNQLYKGEILKEWDIMWKSRGGIIVNGVPREVPMPKIRGATGPGGFWLRDLPRDKGVKFYFLQPVDSLGSIMVNEEAMKRKPYILVESNPLY